MRVMTALLASALVAGATSTLPAQIPAEFKNLQVLSKDISRRDLVLTMRQIATDLGVRCTHCHVGPDDLQGMDFATDEKRTKQVARTMLAMTRAINDQYVSRIPEGDAPRQPVTCMTCHRRAARPTRALHDILVETAVAGGEEAALAEYDRIRETFMGSGLYDFREHTLNIAGNMLRERHQRVREAAAMFNRNAALFPGSANAQFAAGQAAQALGLLAEAEAYYRKVLAIDPAHRGALNGLAGIKR